VPFLDQYNSGVPAAGLQSISLVFGAASLAQSALRPPVKAQIAAAGTAAFDVINVDATLSEVHTAEIELTQHPVETGADITDHARQKPREVKLDGFITNSPMDDSLVMAGARALASLAVGGASAQAAVGLNGTLNILQQFGTEPVRDAFDKFQRLYQNATLVNLYGPFRNYTNMILVSFQADRRQDVGDGLKFTATFREVFFVSSQQITVSVVPGAQGALDMGAQSPAPAPTKLVRSQATTLRQWYNGIASSSTSPPPLLALQPRQ
jgi:hypothetical protein